MAEVRGIDYFGPDFLGTEIDFEQPMTADAIKVRQDLCAFYAIPENCLLSRVPPILKAVDDHVLFPFSPNWSGTRWVRVSNFSVLKQVCYKFRKILKDKTIKIFLMPYTPLLDAYLIHQLIENPGRIQLSDDDDDNNAAADSSDGQALPVSGRSGVLKLSDPHRPDATCHFQLRFTVINYGLLWAKASEHLEFIASCNQSKELIGQMEEHRHHVMQNPNNASSILSADDLLNLEERIEATKLDFLLSLHKHEIDPHDSIHAMDAELHEELYDPGYDPCYPGDRTQYPMVQATQAAVEMYMHQLEADHDVYHIREAEWNILMSEGVYEAEAHRSNALNQFFSAMKTCTDELLDAMNKIKIFDSKPSLIGVKGCERKM